MESIIKFRVNVAEYYEVSSIRHFVDLTLATVSFNEAWQWRIQDFRGGTQLQGRGAQTIITGHKGR